ncbi:MAG: DUF1192 family protein [Elstera sp.]
MQAEEERPRQTGDQPVFLSAAALERAGIEELQAYRTALLAELPRIDAEIEAKRNRRGAADALFKF